MLPRWPKPDGFPTTLRWYLLRPVLTKHFNGKKASSLLDAVKEDLNRAGTIAFDGDRAGERSA